MFSSDQYVDLRTLEFVSDNVECWFSCECGITWKQIFKPFEVAEWVNGV